MYGGWCLIHCTIYCFAECGPPLGEALGRLGLVASSRYKEFVCGFRYTQNAMRPATAS